MKKDLGVISTQTRILFIVVDVNSESLLLEVARDGLSPFATQAEGEFALNEICALRDDTAVRTTIDEVLTRLQLRVSGVQRIMRIMSHVSREVTEVLYVFAVHVSLKDLRASDHLQVLSLAQKAKEEWDQISPVHRALVEYALTKVRKKTITQDESADVYTH